MKFLFPFNKIPAGSNIIIYGAGICGMDYFKWIRMLDYCRVLLWVDKKSEKIGRVLNNVKISSIYDIKDYIDETDFVVIAIENDAVSAEIMDFLRDQHIPSEKIVHSIVNLEAHERPALHGERLLKTKPEYFLPYIPPADMATAGERENDKRIKVRFAIQSKSEILVFKTIAKAFVMDDIYDVMFVVTGILQGVNSYLRHLDIPYVYGWDYHIEEDRPQIFFMHRANDPYYQKLYTYASHIIAVPMAIMKWDGVTSVYEFRRQIKDEYPFFEPEYYILDKVLYNEFLKADILEGNMALIGNPKFDVIYNCLQKEKVYPKDWEKLRQKKTILWATDHVFWSKNITFDIYAKKIFEYMIDNEDMAVIFRPHPNYIIELLDNQIWSGEELAALKRYIAASPNIVWDESDSYENAYRFADAIMVDAGCGIICSGLTLDIPIGAMLRPEVTEASQEEIVSRLYRIHSEENLLEFMDMVKAGEDPKSEERRGLLNQSVNHFDGKNGLRIKAFVEAKCLAGYEHDAQKKA